MIRLYRGALLFIGLLMGLTLSPIAVYAATPPKFTQVDCPKDQGVLGFPAWFEGLKCTKSDDPKDTYLAPTLNDVNDTWIIVMNIVQWLILAGGYVALYFIIWAGFKFIIAQGEPDKIKSARDTIANSIIGLIIVIAAVAIVRTIQAGVIKGNIT